MNGDSASDIFVRLLSVGTLKLCVVRLTFGERGAHGARDRVGTAVPPVRRWLPAPATFYQKEEKPNRCTVREKAAQTDKQRVIRVPNLRNAEDGKSRLEPVRFRALHPASGRLSGVDTSDDVHDSNRP